MNRLIYVETSIPSFYFETRQRPEHQARRQWTRDWWELARLSDTLVTWNCRHIANANKTSHIQLINGQMGYKTPLLVTPMELLESNS